MSFKIITTTKIEDAANFVALSITKHLQSGNNVLFFVTGGSSIAVAAKVAELLKKNPYQNNLISKLTIMLTDERYGPVGHADSNWQQLIEKGFSLPNAKLIPILTGDERDVTTEKFNENIKREFEETDFKIGLFGIGADGHTAGILPESGAINCQELAFGYNTPTFSRVTITPKTVEKFDEIIVWAQGNNKWNVIRGLEKEIDILKQPAQILKKVPLLTIFTDYSKTI